MKSCWFSLKRVNFNNSIQSDEVYSLMAAHDVIIPVYDINNKILSRISMRDVS